MANIVGLDIGTMNVVSAKQVESNIEINQARNMFIEVDTTLVSEDDLSKTDLDYITLNDGSEDKVYIVSEDCLKFCQIFSQTPSRPMSGGVISKTELDAVPIMTSIIESLIGRGVEDSCCIYSVPGVPVDRDDIKVSYHERIFTKVLNDLSYKNKALNEAMSVIYSSCQDDNFSAIGLSFGCGMTNCAISYKGLDVFDFSVCRGGDYIDESVADALSVPVSRVTGIKEKKFHLLDDKFEGKNRKEVQVLDALKFYYQDHIDYVCKTFANEFKVRCDNLESDDSIPIIISGGTSLPKGFLEYFKTSFESYSNFPYTISEIRYAKDQLNAVAIGNLIYGLNDAQKKL